MKGKSSLSHKKILELDRDPKQAAKAANLMYVSVSDKGITRKKRGKKLGNTRNICKKYYIHPVLIQLYEKNKLNDYCLPSGRKAAGLSAEEKTLMQVVKKSMQNFTA